MGARAKLNICDRSADTNFRTVVHSGYPLAGLSAMLRPRTERHFSVRHYLRIDGDGKALGVWRISTTEAVRLGISNPQQGSGCYFRADLGEDVFSAIRRGADGWFGPNGESPFHEVTLAPGQFYPRMARPNDQHPSESPGFYPGLRHDQNALAMTHVQLAVLMRALDRICETVHPSAENMAAFGHDIRNLLVLASMEAEAQWRGILAANGVTADRLTTADYVKLLAPMRLAAYRVRLTAYPWLAGIAPFATWAPAAPTKSLGWYDAYNLTKHDRETAFSTATLEHAITAVFAVVVMVLAQYGSPYALGQRTELSDRFAFDCLPEWDPGDVYIYPYDDTAGWSPTPFPL